jgi:nonsense-mediated mRNA decay protein 3
MKFCFVCGKETDKLVEGYCEDCYNQKFNLIAIPKKLEVILCTKCHKVKDGVSWTDQNVEDIVKKKLKLLGNCKSIEVKGKKICVSGTLEKSGKAKEESHDANFKVIKIVCPTCSKRLGGYYETVIQLRGVVSNSVLKLVDSEITRTSYYRVEAVKGGFDLFVGDKSAANKVVNILMNSYKFKISKNYRLSTKKDGRDVYKGIITVICD